MELSHLSCICVMILVEICLAQNGHFITWDDLMVNTHRIQRTVDPNGHGDSEADRMITVDSNGHGDSLTVNDAIHMVPENNAQRVKIHVLPGVYRFDIYFVHFTLLIVLLSSSILRYPVRCFLTPVVTNI